MTKNKFLLPVLIIIFLGFLILRTSSFFFNSVKGENNIIKLSEWKPAESKLEIYKDNIPYSIEEDIVDQNPSSFLQNLMIDKNKYLSFQYKIESGEDAPGFDNPNFMLSINNEIVFIDYAELGSWKKVFINLSNYKSSDNKYIIDFLTKNTFDEINSPTLFVKEISTSKFLAKKNDVLKFKISKNNAEIHIKYFVEENGNLIQKHQILSDPFEFIILEDFVNNEVEYYSVDNFGNVENSKYAIIYTDFEPPSRIEDLNCFNELDQKLNVIFKAPYDDFTNQPVFYESVISNSEILENTDWNLLEKIKPSSFKKFGFSNLASNSGASENLLFENISSDKKYFAIKSIDQAGNKSEISSCFR